MNDAMTCAEAEGCVLRRLDTGAAAAVPEPDARRLEAHLAVCSTCAQFAAQQAELDRRLSGVLAPARLPDDVRQAVLLRVARTEAAPAAPGAEAARGVSGRQLWAGMLPDYAHVGGGVVALGLAVAVAPGRAGTILSVGAVVMALTYAAQTLVASLMEEAEERRSMA